MARDVASGPESGRRRPEPRQRLIAGAADMLRRRGLSATSIRDLAEHSNAPLGSTYHYFPGGKTEVVTEAVRYAGHLIERVLAEELERGPVHGLRSFLDLWRDSVTRSRFRAGCPVLAVTVEDPTDGDTTVIDAAAEVFAAWEFLLASALRAHGARRKQARQVATLVVASIEGTVALCRAERSIRPLDDVAAQLEAVVASAIGEAETKGS
jgi:AcrR family transcriptional regulator